MIRVLIVDDSAFMRNTLSSMIASDPDIEVAGIARDGIEAVDKVALLKPDIVTLDVEMPRMDGIETLKQIMAQHPVPVLMVSSLTTEGAQVTLDALDLGAVDFIPKNLSDLSVNIVRIKEILINKIKAIGNKGLVRQPKKVTVKYCPPRDKSRFSLDRRISVIAIGSSTGGPRALQNILPVIPASFSVPIVIAQHMPPSFTGPLAARLNQLSEITVKEAEEGEMLQKGTAYIAPGRGHMRLVRRRLTETIVSVSEDRGEYIYRPSVDALMLSVVECFPGHSLGVILTGLGNDGTRGMKEIKNKGGRTIAESEQTCVVYGMPKAAADAGAADKVVPLDEIAGEIINSV